MSKLAPEDASERDHVADADFREDLLIAAAAFAKEVPHRFHAFQLQVFSRRDAVGRSD